MPLSLAVVLNVYITAARSPPRSEQANSHDGRPRHARLGGIVAETDPAIIEEAGVRPANASACNLSPLRYRQSARAGCVRSASILRGPRRAARYETCAPPDARPAGSALMSRSIAKISSMRCTASIASGECHVRYLANCKG